MIDEDALERANVGPESPLNAITHDRGPPPGQESTHASPHAFVCDDSKTYWVKNRAQRGLHVELIAGRLADLSGAGPLARAVVVPAEALPVDPQAKKLEGFCVGTVDLPDTVNSKYMAPFVGDADAGLELDARSLVLAMAFRTWIGADDAQVLVNLKTGQVHSIDHGEALVVDPLGTALVLRLLPVPGVDPSVGRDLATVQGVVSHLAAITDDQIAAAVSCMPAELPFAVADRLQLAIWLSDRRNRLEEVMRTWLP